MLFCRFSISPLKTHKVPFVLLTCWQISSWKCTHFPKYPRVFFFLHFREEMESIIWECSSAKALTAQAFSIKCGDIKLVLWNLNQFSFNKTFINLLKNYSYRNHILTSGLKSMLFFSFIFWDISGHSLVWNEVLIYCVCSDENLTKFSIVTMFVRKVACQSNFSNLHS